LTGIGAAGICKFGKKNQESLKGQLGSKSKSSKINSSKDGITSSNIFYEGDGKYQVFEEVLEVEEIEEADKSKSQ